MLLLLSLIVIAVAVGFLRGGSLSRIGERPLELWWLALVGLVLQAVPMPDRTAATMALLISYGVLAWFAWANRARFGFWFILLGLCANFLVVALNNGMPVSQSALERAGEAETLTLLIREGGVKHHLADGDSLMALADVIPVGDPYRVVLSIGDVAIYLGMAGYVVSAMGRGRRDYLPPEPDPGVESTDLSPG